MTHPAFPEVIPSCARLSSERALARIKVFAANQVKVLNNWWARGLLLATIGLREGVLHFRAIPCAGHRTTNTRRIQ